MFYLLAAPYRLFGSDMNALMVGSLMINAIFSRDFPTIQAVALFVALFVIVVGILTDVVYTLIDPRVDLSSKERA